MSVLIYQLPKFFEGLRNCPIFLRKASIHILLRIGFGNPHGLPGSPCSSGRLHRNGDTVEADTARTAGGSLLTFSTPWRGVEGDIDGIDIADGISAGGRIDLPFSVVDRRCRLLFDGRVPTTSTCNNIKEL
jgi:hypothetical protein